jgi:hypothetical protein
VSISQSSDGTILLEGACLDDDAELLLAMLSSTPAAPVDWRLCTAAHSAVLQVLLASGAHVTGPPADPGLARWLAPLLRRPTQ